MIIIIFVDILQIQFLIFNINDIKKTLNEKIYLNFIIIILLKYHNFLNIYSYAKIDKKEFISF